MPFFRDTLQKMFPTAWTPRSAAHDGYQYDLDGSLRYDRFKTGIDYFPWVGGDGTIPQIGMVDGFLQQFDALVWSQMTGKVPSGPFATTQPINIQWQTTIPGLTKYS